MSYANVHYNIKLPEVEAKLKAAIPIAIRMMMDDIKQKADPITPYKTGVLRGSVSKTLLSPTHGQMVWNMPYAAYQERGMRADGTRVVQNYTTPGTDKEYALRAVEQVKNNGAEYIRKAGFI